MIADLIFILSLLLLNMVLTCFRTLLTICVVPAGSGVLEWPVDGVVKGYLVRRTVVRVIGREGQCIVMAAKLLAILGGMAGDVGKTTARGFG